MNPEQEELLVADQNKRDKGLVRGFSVAGLLCILCPSFIAVEEMLVEVALYVAGVVLILVGQQFQHRIKKRAAQTGDE